MGQKLEDAKFTLYNIVNFGIDEVKKYRVHQSKLNLNTYLDEHPIQSKCHKDTNGFYSITTEKQQMLAQMIIMAMMSENLGVEYNLSWNQTGKECTYDWTLSELQTLAFEIEQVIRPLVSKQQKMEQDINACETGEEVLLINVTFETETEGE